MSQQNPSHVKASESLFSSLAWDAEHPSAVTSGRRGIDRAVEFAVRHFGEDLTLLLLAKAASMPCNTLTRKFNHRFGLSPMRWVWVFRTYLAAELINYTPEWALTDIAVYCGFGSSAHFSRRFSCIIGESPSRYRTKARQRLKTLGKDFRSPVRFFDENPVVVAKALTRASASFPNSK
jgi:transcriptional regulator GlxA family with amidase domain